jgi:hypothetical protein
MSDKVDILLKYWEEERAQGRQSENQRATVTNYIIIISSLIITFVVNNKLEFYLWPLAIMLVFLGVFGIVITRKYYERWKLHMSRAKYLMEEAQGILDIDTSVAMKKGRKEHKEDCQKNYLFKNIHAFPLYKLWDVFYIFIILIGVVFLFIIIGQPDWL